MRARFPGAVTSRGVDPVAAHAYVHTTGGASPSIESSFGVASITDSGVGLLDVTWNVAFGGANYTVIPSIQIANSSQLIAYVSNDNVPTATAVRINIVNASTGTSTDIGTGGTHVMCFGEGY